MPLKDSSTLTFDFSPERVSGAFFEGVKLNLTLMLEKIHWTNSLKP
jgi:hypothetical protein